jgi:hypothetical protein
MDFLDPKKKRAHKIRLYIGYALMAVALGIGTFILLFEAFGYDVDRKTGEVIQNGLVFADAHPEQAQVYLNGRLEGQTDTRLTVPTGDYTLEMKRDGYRDWKKSFELKGSVVERYNYAFLFPQELKTQDMELYGSMPSFATQSPDRKWLLVLQPGKFDTFDLYDLGADNLDKTTVAIPAGLMNTSQPERKLELVEWSNDNRHVVLKHSFKGGSEFVIFDRQVPAESVNINATFNIPISEVSLRDKKWDKLHILDANGGILRFGDVKPKSLSIIGSRVLAFKTYGDEVMIYITDQGAPEGKVLVNVRRDSDTYKIRELSAGTKYFADVTRYDNEWFMAAGSDTDKAVYVYKEVFHDVALSNPRIPAPIAVLRLGRIEYLSISANTRFIGIQGGSEFATYDAEYDRQHRFDTGIKLIPGYQAKWMDGHRYTVVSDGKLIVFEFDGTNQQTLTASEQHLLPYFDRDYDNLFMITKSVGVQDRASLNKTPMRTEPDL